LRAAINYLVATAPGTDLKEARGILTEDFQTVSTTKEISLAIMLKRPGSSLFAYGHSADGIDRLIGCVHFVRTPGDVYLLLIIFFHAMPTSSLRDCAQIPDKFSNVTRDSEEITLNLRGMTFAETNPQSCFAAKSGKYAND
jgi:hypothetical protein